MSAVTTSGPNAPLYFQSAHAPGSLLPLNEQTRPRSAADSHEWEWNALAASSGPHNWAPGGQHPADMHHNYDFSDGSQFGSASAMNMPGLDYQDALPPFEQRAPVGQGSSASQVHSEPPSATAVDYTVDTAAQLQFPAIPQQHWSDAAHTMPSESQHYNGGGLGPPPQSRLTSSDATAVADPFLQWGGHQSYNQALGPASQYPAAWSATGAAPDPHSVPTASDATGSTATDMRRNLSVQQGADPMTQRKKTVMTRSLSGPGRVTKRSTKPQSSLGHKGTASTRPSNMPTPLRSVSLSSTQPSAGGQNLFSSVLDHPTPIASQTPTTSAVVGSTATGQAGASLEGKRTKATAQFKALKLSQQLPQTSRQTPHIAGEQQFSSCDVSQPSARLGSAPTCACEQYKCPTILLPAAPPGYTYLLQKVSKGVTDITNSDQVVKDSSLLLRWRSGPEGWWTTAQSGGSPMARSATWNGPHRSSG